jgi:hypothetical protein
VQGPPRVDASNVTEATTVLPWHGELLPVVRAGLRHAGGPAVPPDAPQLAVEGRRHASGRDRGLRGYSSIRCGGHDAPLPLPAASLPPLRRRRRRQRRPRRGPRRLPYAARRHGGHGANCVRVTSAQAAREELLGVPPGEAGGGLRDRALRAASEGPSFLPLHGP